MISESSFNIWILGVYMLQFSTGIVGFVAVSLESLFRFVWIWNSPFRFHGQYCIMPLHVAKKWLCLATLTVSMETEGKIPHPNRENNNSNDNTRNFGWEINFGDVQILAMHKFWLCTNFGDVLILAMDKLWRFLFWRWTCFGDLGSIAKISTPPK